MFFKIGTATQGHWRLLFILLCGFSLFFATVNSLLLFFHLEALKGVNRVGGKNRRPKSRVSRQGWSWQLSMGTVGAIQRAPLLSSPELKIGGAQGRGAGGQPHCVRKWIHSQCRWHRCEHTHIQFMWMIFLFFLGAAMWKICLRLTFLFCLFVFFAFSFTAGMIVAHCVFFLFLYTHANCMLYIFIYAHTAIFYLHMQHNETRRACLRNSVYHCQIRGSKNKVQDKVKDIKFKMKGYNVHERRFSFQ